MERAAWRIPFLISGSSGLRLGEQAVGRVSTRQLQLSDYTRVTLKTLTCDKCPGSGSWHLCGFSSKIVDGQKASEG